MKRTLCLLLAATGSSVAIASSLAWACSPQSGITMIPQVAPARSSAVVQGTIAAPGPGMDTVQIRWNSVDGPVVGSATTARNGSFAADIEIPEAAPGVYYLVATSDGSDAARVAVEVTGGKGASVTGSADLWEGFESGQTNLSRPASPGTSRPMWTGLVLAVTAAGALGAGLAASARLRTRRASSGR